jgi:hypothetical protein
VNRFVRILSALGLAATVIALSGCAAPASQQAMAVSAPAKILKRHPFSVSVTTSGGAETSSMGSSAIANADLKAAIEKSILESKVFNEVVQGNPGQYQLNVAVTQIDKPVFGASFTVTLETAWSLVRTSDKQVIWRKAISGAHTATMSDAFVGVKRLQLAVEGAARANIEQGLSGISEAVLDGARQATAAPK